MLVRVLNCAEGGDVRGRMQRLLGAQPDTFVEALPDGREPFWRRLAQSTGDIAFVSRSSVSEPAARNVRALGAVPRTPRLVILSSAHDVEDESRLVASGCLMLYIEDVDARYARAVAAGAKVQRPVKDQFYGDRAGTVIDPYGHVWTIGTHTEDVSLEEIYRRFATVGAQCETPA